MHWIVRRSVWTLAAICVSTNTHLTAQTGSSFVAVTPCRLLDTRNPAGALGGPSMAAGSTRSFPFLASSCGIPSDVSAYSINVTVLPQGPFGFLTLWPTGANQPVVATLLSPAGQNIANAAIIAAGTNGAVNAYVTSPADLIFDLTGYFIPETAPNTQSTAIGSGASNAGSQNTGVGFDALEVNSGNSNTAIGASGLSANTSGNNNVAVGSNSLSFNATGSANTAIGTQSLLNNLIGSGNAGVGFSTLWSNTTGNDNAAVGENALFANTSGSENTAVGQSALAANTVGSSNIAIGYDADNQATSGSYNIEIGAQGYATDSNTIRIGSSQNQTSTFIAGINGVNISVGSAVLINSNGQLGTAQSSLRYKKDIRDIGDDSDRIMKLRPVMFRYRDAAPDGSWPIQYGLIGEEVVHTFPELVVYGPDGEIQSVEYHELPALLLNELQKQHRTIEKQRLQLQDAQDKFQQQENAIRRVEQQLRDLDAQLKRTK